MTRSYSEEEILRWSAEKMLLKENQEWDMAGLARQDGDTSAEEVHTTNARRILRLRREL